MFSFKALVSIVGISLSVTSAASAAECQFDTMVGITSGAVQLRNFGVPFLTDAHGEGRDGSLPCELEAYASAPTATYIQSTKSLYTAYSDEFVFGGYSQWEPTPTANGQAVVRRYEFQTAGTPNALRHLSFLINGDGQAGFLTISQTLTTARPAGINRKIYAGTIIQLTVAPGSNGTSLVRIAFWNENPQLQGAPIEFTTSPTLQLFSLKQGNVVPMNFQGTGRVYISSVPPSNN